MRTDAKAMGVCVGTKPLGVVLKARRQLLGMSQTEVATYLDVDHTYLSHLEAGRRVPSIALLRRFVALSGRPLTLTISED